MSKPTYKTSTGERLTTSQIETRMKYSKGVVIQNQFDEHRYNFCQKCNKNSSNTRIDVSHNISVKEAKESGKTELCWDIRNMEILCRECHEEKDKLNIQFNDTITNV